MLWVSASACGLVATLFPSSWNLVDVRLHKQCLCVCGVGGAECHTYTSDGPSQAKSEWVWVSPPSAA